MPLVPTNVLIQYTMVGQLLTNSGPNAYQLVYWDVYNAADMTGMYSGYYGQLQNISIANQVNVSSPASNANVPTGPAGGDLYGNYPNPDVGGIGGVPFSASPPTAPTLGQVPTFNGTTIVWTTPGLVTAPTPRVTTAGGTVLVPLNAESWDESNGATGAAYMLPADTANYGHIIGWLGGSAPSVKPPAGWSLQSPIDGVLRNSAFSFTYGTGGNPVGERYTWRAIVASLVFVPC